MLPRAILFDLDGTVLPLVQDDFVREYFRRLTAFMAPHGYDPDLLKKAIWAGIRVMETNDGSRMNEAIFWDTFRHVFGRDVTADMPYFDAFYRGDFENVKEAVFPPNPDAVALIRKLKTTGIPVVLATNPVFPRTATEARSRWAGLTPDDFTLVTTFENGRISNDFEFCRPLPTPDGWFENVWADYRQGKIFTAK